MIRPPLQRRQITSARRPYVAYDLETTRIQAGTPTVKYITAYGENFNVSRPTMGKDPQLCLLHILERFFLKPEYKGYRYIAWNGNNFDAYFIADALTKSNRWLVKPYVTRSKALRGLRVLENDTKNYWEFLDGVAMTGLFGKSLASFVAMFAPDYPKLKIDFDTTEFDPKNPDHVAYAERDSEALYHALLEVNRIVSELTGNELQPTIGNLAIKYVQSRIPEETMVWEAPYELRDTLYTTIKRGGYCWIQKQFAGPVWKYDINQAYASAMRDCALPAGRCFHTKSYIPDRPGVYHVYIGRLAESPIPFYYRPSDKNIGAFTAGAYVDTWLTSTEIEHLIRDGWLVEYVEGFHWDEYFHLTEMVAELERLRFSDPKGPNGPLGTMVKYIGNSAYGKTLERLEGIELVMAADCPEGYSNYLADMAHLEDAPYLKNIYFKFRDPFSRVYHRPQIGDFITAHVRIVVREAALQNPDAFLYADTDSVVFSEPVQFLDVDPKRYGAWKQETDGDHAILIGKKVYWCDEGQTRKAKGLYTKHPGSSSGSRSAPAQPRARSATARHSTAARWGNTGTKTNTAAKFR